MKEKYKVLSKADSELLFKIIGTEHHLSGADLDIPDSELPFLCKVVKKRVEVAGLPVQLTNSGLLAINAFTDSPGGAVALLVDFLTKYEGQKMTAKKLCELYPWGFYTQEALEEYIDTKLKPRTVKWSELY